jgi:hypothetical protein
MPTTLMTRRARKKVDEGNGDFQEPDKSVNVLFDGLPTKHAQKLTLHEVMSIEPVVPTPLRWSELPITFSHANQWKSFSEPERFPLILNLVLAGSRLTRVIIDGGSGLNVLFSKTLKTMKLDITSMLTKSMLPFYGIIPGNTAMPLGSVVLLVTFRTRENYRIEDIKFEVADFENSYHAIVLTLQGDLKVSYDCGTEVVELAATNKVPNTMMEIFAAS